MTYDQRLIAEITTFVDENEKHLPVRIKHYLRELVAMNATLAKALTIESQKAQDLRAILYGNPDAQHDRNQAGGVQVPQRFVRGSWVDQ